MEFRISDKARERIEELKRRYPAQQSAVMGVLYIVQEEHGCIPEAGVVWVAENLGLAPVHVRELVTFYSMYRSKPLGKYHLQICRTLSCAVLGANGLVSYLENRLKVRAGEVTADGFWSYELVECLGSCGTGPVVQINDTYFELMNPEKLGGIMDRIEAERPDLSFSTIHDRLGDGLSGCPRSQVYRGGSETA